MRNSAPDAALKDGALLIRHQQRAPLDALSKWESDPFGCYSGSFDEAESDMSLALGLRGTQSVVIAADSYGYQKDAEGMYGENFSKLLTVNDRKWALGIAGSGSAKSIADELERKQFAFDGQIDDSIHKYSKELENILRERGFTGEWLFVLGAFDGRTPCMYEWYFLEKQTILPRRSELDIVAIGARKHGALYFSHAHHKADMNDQQRALLAHFCISEAANQDPRIDRPVDIAVVRPEGARMLAPEELSEYERASAALSSEIGNLIRGYAPKPFIAATQRLNQRGAE